MRYVNENFETIKEMDVDLSKGHFETAIAIREDATPIDNITKFAWDDGDYEEVQMYILNQKLDELVFPEKNETDKIIDVLLGVEG